jgi:hypothetical protein
VQLLDQSPRRPIALCALALSPTLRLSAGNENLIPSWHATHPPFGDFASPKCATTPGAILQGLILDQAAMTSPMTGDASAMAHKAHAPSQGGAILNFNPK